MRRRKKETMTQFQRLVVSQDDFTSRDYEAEINLFASDEAPVEQLVSLLNLYYSGLSYSQTRTDKVGGLLSSRDCINYMFDTAIQSSIRNTRLFFVANAFFDCDIEFCASYHEFGIAIQPLKNLRQLFSVTIKVYGLCPDYWAALRAGAEKNPDERVKYYLAYTQHETAHLVQQWDHAGQQAGQQLVLLNQLRKDPASYLSVLPRDLSEYVINPYLRMYYRYL